MKHSEKLISRAKICNEKCPVCTRARKKGKGVLYQIVKIERHVCPYCKSYETVFDKPAYR